MTDSGSDPWSRSGAPEQPRGPVFEIPLDGDGPLVDRTAPDSPRGERSTNWRKLVALSSIVGVVLGVIVAVAVMGGGDGADESDGLATGTTLSVSDLTTPPTLSPLVEIPAPGSDVNPGGPSTGSGSLELPQYPEMSEGTADIPNNLQLTAITEMADSVPRRSTTEYSSTLEGAGVAVDVAHDPTTDRFELTFRSDDFADEGASQTVIVDMADDSLYSSFVQDDQWIRSSISDIESSDPMLRDLRTFLMHVLLGPVRPSTFAAVTAIDPGPLVMISDLGLVAREFSVTMPATEIPEWSRYPWGAYSGETPADDEMVNLAVYIDETGSIVRVQGINAVGDESQSVIHTIETLDGDPSIELPDPGLVIAAEDLGTNSSQTADDLRPVYGQLADDGSIDGSFDGDAALATLAATPPLRSQVTSTSPGNEFVITTEFDPAADRIASTFELLGQRTLTIREIEDRSTGRVLRQNRDGEQWLREEVAVRGSAAEPQYLNGLVDPSVLRAADGSIDRGLVRLLDGTAARHFEFAVDAAEIDLPVDVAMQLLLDRRATVHLYVDARDLVLEIQILSNGDDAGELLIQRFDYNQDAPVVTFPDPADIVTP